MGAIETTPVSRPATISSANVFESTVTAEVVLPASGIVEFLSVSGVVKVSAFGSFFVGADSRVELFEGSTVSDSGTPIPSFARDRTSPLITTMTLFGAPTVTDAGLLLWGFFLGGGSDKNASRNFGADEDVAPVVLLPSTNYLLRVTNLTAAPSTFFTAYTFVEDKPPA